MKNSKKDRHMQKESKCRHTLPLATRVYYHPNHPWLRGISGTINTPRAHCEGAWHILEHPGAGPGAVKR